MDDCSSKLYICDFVLNTVLTYCESNCDQEKLFWTWVGGPRINSQDRFIRTGNGQSYFWNRVLPARWGWCQKWSMFQFSTKLSKKIVEKSDKIDFFLSNHGFCEENFFACMQRPKNSWQPYLFNRVKEQIMPNNWDIETYKNNLENEIFYYFIIWIKHWTKYLLLLLFPSRCLPSSLQMQWSWDLQKWWIMPVWSWILRQQLFR